MRVNNGSRSVPEKANGQPNSKEERPNGERGLIPPQIKPTDNFYEKEGKA